MPAPGALPPPDITASHAIDAFTNPSTCQNVKLIFAKGVVTDTAPRKNHAMSINPEEIRRGRPNLATAAETTAPPFCRAAFMTASACSFVTCCSGTCVTWLMLPSAPNSTSADMPAVGGTADRQAAIENEYCCPLTVTTPWAPAPPCNTLPRIDIVRFPSFWFGSTGCGRMLFSLRQA